MVKVLDMQFIRYANLFSKITYISTNHCFEYNHTIIFVVPRKFVMKAIGLNNINLPFGEEKEFVGIITSYPDSYGIIISFPLHRRSRIDNGTAFYRCP